MLSFILHACYMVDFGKNCHAYTEQHLSLQIPSSYLALWLDRARNVTYSPLHMLVSLLSFLSFPQFIILVKYLMMTKLADTLITLILFFPFTWLLKNLGGINLILQSFMSPHYGFYGTESSDTLDWDRLFYSVLYCYTIYSIKQNANSPPKIKILLGISFYN